MQRRPSTNRPLPRAQVRSLTLAFILFLTSSSSDVFCASSREISSYFCTCEIQGHRGEIGGRSGGECGRL